MDTHIEFKRKIDNARNILVGAVPSPAGQIDQITYALIYKFMSDIDDKTARLPGGVRQYFVGEFEKYDWHNLMRLDGQDKLNRYRDALSKMNENSHLPEIFRSIYQNAFLPYNDPRTLNLFLKEIDGFVHNKSDAIGDAYEYLLSITGAQGDVGQFRTPRHIIKFIVDVVKPAKSDTVLDPACGTAGFLIAAYNYVRMQHDGLDEYGNQNGEQRLTADEREKLHSNYYGYDIDPTMVRTSTVNMYLHGFSTPNIEIYDTLTSEEHWSKRFDVIFANPPFMTPKGGIEPHGKFGVKANRAEVLFVDYIASHLKPNGRAGIIVPEGIIFQSGNAYKELRKNLVDSHLYAIVSLPSGVFNPYAGVKTSILLLDKELAAKKDEILFVKIENDGYSLGAQRRKIAGDQLPEAIEVIERFKNDIDLQTKLAHKVSKEQIINSGDYNLSGDKYRPTLVVDSKWPVVEIGEYLDYIRGLTYSKSDETIESPNIKVLRANNIDLNGQIVLDDIKTISTSVKTKDTHVLRKNDIFICAASGSKDHIGKVAYVDSDTNYFFGGFMAVLRMHEGLYSKYAYYQLRSEKFNTYLRGAISGASINNLNSRILGSFKIPLPPIDIQRKIVVELESYQRIIDAAQVIVKTYKPTIKISLEWKTVVLGDHLEVFSGYAFKSSKFNQTGEGMPIIRIRDVKPSRTITYYTGEFDHKYIVKNGDLLIGMDGEFNPTIWQGGEALLNQRVCRLEKFNGILPGYAFEIVKDELKKIESSTYAITVKHISAKQIKDIEIRLPSIEIQRQIVTQLEVEASLIDANKKLNITFQNKIKEKIDEIWGE